MADLTGKQKRYLRGLGHHLKPVVQVGQRGIHETVIEKVLEELENHELIKLKIGQDCLEDTKEAGAALAEACEASLVQVIGRTVLLYRTREDEPDIQLP